MQQDVITPFPYLRKQSKKQNSIRVEIMADSMRVGKTTAVQVLADGMRNLGYTVFDSYEDWQNNPYLKESYADPARNFLDSQKWFVKRKYEQIMAMQDKNVAIQDVSPEMDYCYAVTNLRLGRMAPEHFAEYDQFFHSLQWSRIAAPTVLVYLTVSDDILLKRANDSKREFENVDSEYFLMMKRVNREWLAGVPSNQYRAVMIDTDRLNFAHERYAKEKLIYKVIDCISN